MSVTTRNQIASTVSARLPMPSNVTVSAQQWRVLTDAIFPTAKTPESVMLALEYCRARNLDPFKRPVHIVPMYSTTLKREIETVWPGINELQVTAARSNAWAGIDDPRFGPDQTYEFTLPPRRTRNEDNIPPDESTPAATGTIVKVTAPEWCSITVYRMVGDKRQAFAGEPVYWAEAYARASRWTDCPNEMWRKRPRGQLMKCAKAASLRAAFPEDLGSTYAAEEMEDRETSGAGPIIDADPDVKTVTVQEEESEFTIRASSRLETAASNASTYLKALLSILAEAPTKDDLATIRAWEGVQKALTTAPTIIRQQIADAIDIAEKRLISGSSSSDPVAETVTSAPEVDITKGSDDIFPGDKP